ncbi:MAG: hypothetical protein KF736_08395 [Acidobacteria bacterium]|nr:hypothetical protein [Acidobacteriota bacterium]MCW5950070.1 hypothetical protein [Pyrinomonadaceae bacterium]
MSQTIKGTIVVRRPDKNFDLEKREYMRHEPPFLQDTTTPELIGFVGLILRKITIGDYCRLTSSGIGLSYSMITAILMG